MLKTSHVLLAVALCAGLYLASRVVSPIAPAHASLGTRIEGRFTEGEGWYPGEPFVSGKPVRAWGSWCGSDTHTGTLTLGPFPAPERLHIAASGYPTHAGNDVVVELAVTKERHPVKFPSDIGERWRVIEADLPPAWIGQPVSLVVTDRATDVAGWLAITEPLRGGRGDGYRGIAETFAAGTINALLLGLLWHAASQWLAPRAWLAPQWLPLAAAGVVAAVGYLAFWIYFASATTGKVFSVALLLGSALEIWRTGRHPISAPAPEAKPRAPVERASTEFALVARLMLGVGALHVALLVLYPSQFAFDALAANRYRENLPGDNTLPYNVARALFTGGNVKTANGEWLSSDRPPLESGWQLLTWPVTAALKIEGRVASGTSGTWFQLLWVAAVYGLLRTLQLAPWRAAAWTAVIGLSGFCVQNTVFTWPKLSAAALACGAAGLWLAPSSIPHRRAGMLLGAMLAALAWLSHGGVAFSFLALAPWLVWRAVRGGWAEQREWLLAAGVFLFFALPWVGYQRFYDPPGDRLLKLHLAGQDDLDPRSTWQLMRDGYRALSWSEIVERKRANLHMQVRGDFRAIADFSPATAATRRSDEFFHSGRALTWWLLGLAALPFIALSTARRAACASSVWLQLHLAAWAIATTVIWCLLMFMPAHAVIHQGSYTILLTFFVVLTVWLDLASRWSLAIVAVLQSLTLATTYAVPNSIVKGSPIGLPFVVLAALALAWWLIRGLRTEPARLSAPPPAASA